MREIKAPSQLVFFLLLLFLLSMNMCVMSTLSHLIHTNWLSSKVSSFSILAAACSLVLANLINSLSLSQVQICLQCNQSCMCTHFLLVELTFSQTLKKASCVIVNRPDRIFFFFNGLFCSSSTGVCLSPCKKLWIHNLTAQLMSSLCEY